MDKTDENKQSTTIPAEAVRIVADFVKGNENILLTKGDSYDVSDDPMKVQNLVSKSVAASRELINYIVERFVKPDTSDNTRNYKKVSLGIMEDGNSTFEIGLNDHGFYVSIHESMLEDSGVRKMWYRNIWRCKAPVIPTT